MRDFVNQTKAALSFYVKRGKNAIIAIEADNFEEFERFCKLRKAAYHNFLAADAAALKRGYDVKADVEMLDVIEDMLYVNTELARVMAEKRAALEGQLKKTIKVRSGIGSYKSEDRDQSGTIAREI
jgi:hypothetical protein